MDAWYLHGYLAFLRSSSPPLSCLWSTYGCIESDKSLPRCPVVTSRLFESKSNKSLWCSSKRTSSNIRTWLTVATTFMLNLRKRPCPCAEHRKHVWWPPCPHIWLPLCTPGRWGGWWCRQCIGCIYKDDGYTTMLVNMIWECISCKPRDGVCSVLGSLTRWQARHSDGDFWRLSTYCNIAVQRYRQKCKLHNRWSLSRECKLK